MTNTSQTFPAVYLMYILSGLYALIILSLSLHSCNRQHLITRVKTLLKNVRMSVLVPKSKMLHMQTKKAQVIKSSMKARHGMGM